MAKLTKSNSFDQKMNLATLSVCGRPARVAGKQTKKKKHSHKKKNEREGRCPDNKVEGEREVGMEGGSESQGLFCQVTVRVK